MVKHAFCICENRVTNQTAQLISTFVFSSRIVQFLLFLAPKIQASSLCLCLYRPVHVGTGQAVRVSHDVASSCDSINNIISYCELELTSEMFFIRTLIEPLYKKTNNLGF